MSETKTENVITKIFGSDNQVVTSVKYTGNYYFKPSWFGMVIVVEKVYTYSDGFEVKHFEKAKMVDLFALGLVSASLNNLVNAQG